jgi:hypothetical protein
LAEDRQLWRKVGEAYVQQWVDADDDESAPLSVKTRYNTLMNVREKANKIFIYLFYLFIFYIVTFVQCRNYFESVLAPTNTEDYFAGHLKCINL